MFIILLLLLCIIVIIIYKNYIKLQYLINTNSLFLWNMLYLLRKLKQLGTKDNYLDRYLK